MLSRYILSKIQYISRKPLCVYVLHFNCKTMSNCLLLCCCLFRHVSCIFDLQNRVETNKAEISALHPLIKTPAGENPLDEHVFLDIKYYHQCHPPTSLTATCSLFSSPFLCCQSKSTSTPMLKGLFNSTRTKSSSLVCSVSHNSSFDYFYLLYL